MVLPPWLSRLFGELGQILSLVSQIVGLLPSKSSEPFPGATYDAASASQLLLNDPTYGLNALLAAIDSVGAAQATNTAAILAAIGSPNQVGVPVTLPSPPPTGYGSNPGDVAAEVWSWPSAETGQPANDRLDDATFAAENMSLAGVSLQTFTTPWFRVAGSWASRYSVDTYNSDPLFPIANILADDTLDSFLERESFWTGWDDPTGSDYWEVLQGSPSDFKYITTISGAEFIKLRDSIYVPTSTNLPPVWPGIASVTLGTPVALDATVNVNVPMHGVIIELDSVPPGKPVYPIGDQTATAHIGQVAFVNDNGDMEYPQNLSFPFQIYCPQSMVAAAGVKVRCVPGVTGFVTPWTIV
jgi:hypothetical protein